MDNRNIFDYRSDFLKLGYLFVNIIAPINYQLKLDYTGRSVLQKIKIILNNDKEIYSVIHYLINSSIVDYKVLTDLITAIPDNLTISMVEKNLFYSDFGIGLRLELKKIYSAYFHSIDFLKDNANVDINLFKQNLIEVFCDNDFINSKINESIKYLLYYSESKNEKWILKYTEIVDDLESKIFYKDGVYLIDKNCRNYTPYINTGICGFVLSKILFYKITKDNDVLLSIYKYIESIQHEFIICKPGFVNGGLGLFSVIYDYAIITGDKLLLDKSIKILKLLLLFNFSVKEMCFIPNNDYTGVDISFSRGSLGYIYVLEKVINGEEIIYEHIFKK